MQVEGYFFSPEHHLLLDDEQQPLMHQQFQHPQGLPPPIGRRIDSFSLRSTTKLAYALTGLQMPCMGQNEHAHKISKKPKFRLLKLMKGRKRNIINFSTKLSQVKTNHLHSEI